MTIGFSIKHFLIFGLTFQYGKVINREVKFPGVLDWIICHSKFITMPCLNGISCGIKGLQKV
jgi:hypothetical protein